MNRIELFELQKHNVRFLSIALEKKKCFQIKYKNMWASQTRTRGILLHISYNVKVRYGFGKLKKPFVVFIIIRLVILKCTKFFNTLLY